MKVLGYIRVSSKSQLDGYSIINQKDKINSYCNYMGYDLVEVYEDRGISGMSIDKRNGYRDMLEYLLNNEIDGIVVYSLSRLGRRMKDVIGFLDVLKRNGKSLIAKSREKTCWPQILIFSLHFSKKIVTLKRLSMINSAMFINNLLSK